LLLGKTDLLIIGWGIDRAHSILSGDWSLAKVAAGDMAASKIDSATITLPSISSSLLVCRDREFITLNKFYTRTLQIGEHPA
jgi:hypothetical protein